MALWELKGGGFYGPDRDSDRAWPGSRERTSEHSTGTGRHEPGAQAGPRSPSASHYGDAEPPWPRFLDRARDEAETDQEREFSDRIDQGGLRFYRGGSLIERARPRDRDHHGGFQHSVAPRDRRRLNPYLHCDWPKRARIALWMFAAASAAAAIVMVILAHPNAGIG